MESSAHRVLNTGKGEVTTINDSQKEKGYANDASKMDRLANIVFMLWGFFCIMLWAPKPDQHSYIA